MRNASTSGAIGRRRIRSEPSSVTIRPGVAAKYAVRKRMAVPAAPIDTVSSDEPRAASMTSVSSHLATLVTTPSPPARALIINTRLLMLFDKGKSIIASGNSSGGNIL